MIWIVLSSAVIPDISAAMNFWKRNVIGIGADDQAFIDTIGDAFSIFGLVLYNLFYKNTPYRKIFFYTQILASLFMFSDVILVNRWNKYLYIPDYIFLIGSHTIINTIFSLQGMPVLVMAAQMCPKEIEATFFSTVMSLFNTGGTLSALYGGVLLDFLHIVKIKNELDSNNENYDFHNIIVAVWIRIIGCLVPAFLALYMLPNSNVIETVDDESYQVIEMDNLADEDKMFSIEDEEEEDLNYDDTYSFTKSHDS